MPLPRSHLEKIGDKLEQSEAILAYEGVTFHRIAAVRALLRALRSTVMPTLSMRKQWVSIAEADAEAERRHGFRGRGGGSLTTDRRPSQGHPRP